MKFPVAVSPGHEFQFARMGVKGELVGVHGAQEGGCQGLRHLSQPRVEYRVGHLQFPQGIVVCDLVVENWQQLKANLNQFNFNGYNSLYYSEIYL